MLADGETYWDGVRNYSARLNLRAMKTGDKCLFYHSNKGLEIVGIVEVSKEAYQDPTTDDDRWVAVDVKVVETLDNPVTLKHIKAETILQEMDLVKLSRLSVGKVGKKEFDYIMKLSKQS